MNEDTGLYGPVSSFLLCALPDGFLNGVSGRGSGRLFGGSPCRCYGGVPVAGACAKQT